MIDTEVASTGFQPLGLRPDILHAIGDAGYDKPTPIQAQAIPEVLAGRDVIGIAQTGTGKTASFTLPMLHILAAGRARARMPRSLILSPTRELATQTARNFEIYGKYLSLSMALLIGGVGMADQEKVLEKGVDVLIATPGRLIDWFERGKVLLGGVEILVIDEADRMFDMGFMPDVERIVSLLLGRKQTLLFSATMPPEVRRLANRFLDDPVEIKVAPPSSLSGTVEDKVLEVDHENKRRALVSLIRAEQVPKSIVFCNRKRDIGAVMRHLQRAGLNARDLHGDLEQVHRQATLDQFTRGEVDFLVATDVAARGLDISNMPVVINFDVPMHADDYVHRIGRTGRAGRKGRAYTLVTGDDHKYLSNIERLIKRGIPRLALESARPERPRGEVNGEATDTEPAVAATRRPRRRQPSAAAVDHSPPVRAANGGMEERGATVPESGALAPETAAPEGGHAAAEATPRPTRRRRLPKEVPQSVVAAKAAAVPEPAAAPEPEKKAVVAFGDHVPRFILQPVPTRLSARPRAAGE